MKKSKQAVSKKRTDSTAAAPEIVVVGSVALDILHTPFASRGPVLGGSAVHFSNAASYFARVGMVGVVGDDYPQADLDFLRKRKVDFGGVEVRPGKSFLWEGRYLEHFTARETIRTELGVFAEFEPMLPANYRRPNVLFLAAIHPELQLAVLNKVERPRLVAIDTFKLWIDTARESFLNVLKQSDLLFVNDDEVRWLTGEYNVFKGTEALKRLGPEWIVVKKGEHGSFLDGPKGIFLSHTFPVREVVDPTGAGDAYAGGMLGYLAAGRNLNDKEFRCAMEWASVVGSFYVEGFGPDGLKNVTKPQLRQRFNQLRKMTALP